MALKFRLDCPAHGIYRPATSVAPRRGRFEHSRPDVGILLGVNSLSQVQREVHVTHYPVSTILLSLVVIAIIGLVVWLLQRRRRRKPE